MALPNLYTVDHLADVMVRALGSVAPVLGWDTMASPVREALDDTLAAYGVTDIADATDLAKLRALARREIWRAAHHEASTMYDYTAAAGGSRSRNQMHEHIWHSFQLAAAQAARYDRAFAISSVKVTRTDTPYAVTSTTADEFGS